MTLPFVWFGKAFYHFKKTSWEVKFSGQGLTRTQRIRKTYHGFQLVSKPFCLLVLNYALISSIPFCYPSFYPKLKNTFYLVYGSFFPCLYVFFVHYLLSHPTLKLYFVFQCNAKPRLAQFCLICVNQPKLYLLSSLTHIFRPAKFKPCLLFSPRLRKTVRDKRLGFIYHTAEIFAF